MIDREADEPPDLKSVIGNAPYKCLGSINQRRFWSLQGISEWLDATDASRILVVIDRIAVAASGLAREIDGALGACLRLEFDSFSPNPRTEEAAAAARAAFEGRVNAIVGVGGGSCLDVAKAASLGGRVPDLIDKLCGGDKVYQARPLPFLAIPTTAGTGSEATHFAALYCNGRKISLAHPGIRPSAVVFDLRFHLAMPAKLAAVTGLDALGQAMESLWACDSTPESALFAAAAGPLISRHLLESAVRRSEPARLAMMIGAHLAGQAINISKTTASHALSYQLTQRFGIPHGHAVALTVAHLAAANALVETSNCVDPRGIEHVRARVAEAAGFIGTPISEFPAAFRALLQNLSLPESLAMAGVPREALESLAEAVDPVRLGNNPRRLTVPELVELLNRAFD